MTEHQHFIDTGQEVKIIVKYLKAGILLKYDVYDEDGNLIQPAYKAFEQTRINELLKQGIDNLYYSKVEDDYRFTPSNLLLDSLDPKNRKEFLGINIQTHKMGIQAMSKIVKMVQIGEDIEFSDAKTFTEMVLDDINNMKDNLVNLLSLKIYDDYTYTHSINTGIITMIYGKYLKIDDKTLLEIGLGGFIHDIGKLKIPYKLIHKKDPLSEEEYKIIKKHSIHGYELIKDNSQISQLVKDIVLLHHEKFDGSGYPFQYKGDKIHDEVCIVSLAEAYDTLTSTHPYQKAISTPNTFKLLLTDADKHFKRNITQFFCEKMTHLVKEDQFAIPGAYVLLNTKEIAKVITENKNNPNKPIVQIIIRDNTALSKPLDVDLKLDSTREISRVLNSDEENELIHAMNLS